MSFDEVETAFGDLDFSSMKGAAMSAVGVVAAAAGTAAAWKIGSSAAQNGIDSATSALNVNLDGNNSTPEVV